MSVNTTLDLNQAAAALRTYIRTRQPCFSWGPSGVGKSALMRQVTKQLDLELRDIRISLLDPVDLRGLPDIRDGRTHWSTPEFLPTEGNGVLFLDELNLAPIMNQNACYQLILDRKLGEYTLPDGWVCMAAGNRTEDRAAVHKMSAPLANRFAHIEIDCDIDTWSRWALQNDVSIEVIAFLRFRPALLHNFDKNIKDAAFASPRTWVVLSDTLKALDEETSKFQHSLLSGIVGEAASGEFVGFMRVYKGLPSIDEIMLKPNDAPIPTEPGALYAIATALGNRVTEDTIPAAVKYMERVPSEEFCVLFMQDAIEHCPDVKHTKTFIKWATDHQGVVM